MAGKSTKLTEASINRLPKAPAGKRVEKFDRLAPGLCIRVTSGGRKSWVVHYRRNGKLEKMGLGAWPGLSVEEARDEAHKVREHAAAGLDPRTERDREREAARERAIAEQQALRTFEAVAEEFIAREVPKLKRGKEVESIIRRKLLPEWRNRPITSIRKRDAVKVVDGVVDAGRHAMALHVHKAIKRVFAWASARGEIDVSPFADMGPPTRLAPRQRALTHGEMKKLWGAWDTQGYPFGALHKMLLLTGQRRGEVASMRAEELDDPAEPRVWTIPAERSKNGRAHRVPLSEPARAIIKALPARTAGPFLFSTTDGARPVGGFSKAKDRSDRLSGVAGWRVHDLRRTVRTEMARLGVGETVAERVLNHSADPLVRTYDVYDYEAEKADALEAWGRELIRLIGS